MEKIALELLSRLRCEEGRPEVSAVLYLDDSCQLLDRLITDGESDRLDFPIAPIVRRAVGNGASYLLVFHTHPSGDPRPSAADIAMTRRLCIHLRYQGLRLIDHVILTESRYFSFLTNGLL